MKVFTTGQVAKICKVAPRTVSKWFDSGRIKGYRIPGSQDRRIPREYLIEFLKKHGMPLGDLEDDAMAKVLIVSQDTLLIDLLKGVMPGEQYFKVRTASSGFTAGIETKGFRPDCIIVDLAIGNADALQLIQSVRKDGAHAGAVLIALSPESIPTTIDRLLVNETFKKPFDAKLLAQRVNTLVSKWKDLG